MSKGANKIPGSGIQPKVGVRALKNSANGMHHHFSDDDEEEDVNEALVDIEALTNLPPI